MTAAHLTTAAACLQSHVRHTQRMIWLAEPCHLSFHVAAPTSTTPVQSLLFTRLNHLFRPPVSTTCCGHLFP